MRETVGQGLEEPLVPLKRHRENVEVTTVVMHQKKKKKSTKCEYLVHVIYAFLGESFGKYNTVAFDSNGPRSGNVPVIQAGSLAMLHMLMCLLTKNASKDFVMFFQIFMEA